MNYETHYLKLFQKASNRQENFIGELHHFIPTTFTKNSRHKNKRKFLEKLLGVSYKNSVMLLTFKEHFIAHLLLFKIFKCDSSMYALSFVMNRLKFSMNYGKFRLYVKQKHKERMSGLVCLYDKELEQNVLVSKEEYKHDKERYQGVNKNSECNRREYICEHCNEIIMGGANFSKHQKYYCKVNEDVIPFVDKKIKCNFCEKEIVSIRLKPHERSCKSNPKRSKKIYKMTSRQCKFCKEVFKTSGIKQHEKCCNYNPNKKTLKRVKTKTCKFCKESFSSGLKSHEYSCECNPNKKILISNCLFCHKEVSTSKIKTHENFCNNNPNKKIRKKKKLKTKNCSFCNREISTGNFKRHERSCKLNPNCEHIHYKE